MQIVLTIIYLIFVAVCAFFVVINILDSETKLSTKIGGAILLVILLLRLFLIK